MDPILFYLVATVIVVILLSAMCSLFEAVLYTVPASTVESLEQSGRTSGKILKRLRSKVDQPISAILSLNTISNTGGAALAGALAKEAFDEGNVFVFSVCFTLATLFFAEVIPKTVGVVYSRRLASSIAGPLQLLVWVFLPFVWCLQLLTRVISGKQREERVSDEEFVSLVRLGIRSGDLKAHEADVIENVLALERKTAHDIMTPRTVVFSLNIATNVGEARNQPGLYNYSRIPVHTENHEEIVGVVHRRDVLMAIGDDRDDLKLESLVQPVRFVLENITLDRLLRMFLERREHLIVVMDEYGGLAGIVTLEDVLEEILGKEIVDEFDEVADLRAVAERRREETMRGGAGQE
jgi:CBS domain containing-hemolysin-like protein